MIHRATMSGLKRAKACPPSLFIGPRVESTSDAAEKGTEIHAFVDRCAAGMTIDQSLALVPKEYRKQCSVIELEKLYGDLTDVQTEEAYAIDVVTWEVKCLGNHLERSYPPGDTLVCGSLDIVGTHISDGIVVVRDIKTGRDVAPASDNEQIRTLCYAVGRVRGLDRVRGELCYIHDDGTVRIDSHDFDMLFDFDDMLKDLNTMRKRTMTEYATYQADGRSLTVNRGDHCQYCPAYFACPANASAAMLLTNEVNEIREDTRWPDLSAETAAKAWARLKLVKPLYEEATKQLKQYATEHPFIVGDKLIKGIWTKGRTGFDVESATALLLELGAKPEQIQALVRRGDDYITVREVNAPKEKSQ